MTLETKTLDRIRMLRLQAVNLAEFHAMYAQQYASDSNCDKKGYGFGKDNRFAAFKISTTFDSWRGYYGQSSCSTILDGFEETSKFMIEALNVHQKEIFATAARLMREEAAKLTEKAEEELETLREMLEEAKEG
jgi:hypothetical protein